MFSRPVIASGSDFGSDELPEELVPFTFDPAIPGRGRWVRRFTYRFDFAGKLATDLRIKFAWNLNLRTYDGYSLMDWLVACFSDGVCLGVPLSLDSAESVILTTDGLTMDIVSVTSALARNATDGRWGPFVGNGEYPPFSWRVDRSIPPEVPPDGSSFFHRKSFATVLHQRHHPTIVQRTCISATS